MGQLATGKEMDLILHTLVPMRDGVRLVPPWSTCAASSCVFAIAPAMLAPYACSRSHSSSALKSFRPNDASTAARTSPKSADLSHIPTTAEALVRSRASHGAAGARAFDTRRILGEPER